MGNYLRLTAEDGHELGAWRADPEGAPKGGVVVLQEIFGVNSHIRSVCDRLAAEGYVAVAPALFDRYERDFESGYSPGEVEVARGFIGRLDWDGLMADTRAAADLLRGETDAVSVVGFCLGGSLAFAAATRLEGIAAASCYYGGRIVQLADEIPRCPTQLHFGEADHSIPMSDVETVRAKRPDVELYVYPAGHGFNCDERAAFDPQSAALAWQRTLRLLASATGETKA